MMKNQFEDRFTLFISAPLSEGVKVNIEQCFPIVLFDRRGGDDWRRKLAQVVDPNNTIVESKTMDHGTSLVTRETGCFEPGFGHV